jgi:two-component system response regulator VanR
VNENVRVYFCPGSGEEMGHFRKTGTKAMRGKPHTRRGKIQPYVADTKGRGETDRQKTKKFQIYTIDSNYPVTITVRRCAMSKILIVEDDLSIQALLHDFIQEAGYSVVLAADGVEALAKYSEQSFDLILLDIMLPKIDGFGVCEVIRQKSDVPIIMLTALDDEGNQLKGLDLQADDYITKPFSMPVLLRKIAAVLRRSSKQNDMPQTMSYKDLTLDLEGYKVYTKEESIDLTPREFEILRELLIHKGRILTRQNLLQTLWKYEFFGEERIVDTHIKNLRKKLGAADYIETIRGVGYRIDKED